MIEYNEFSRVELKTAKVVDAEKIPESDKLLKLTVNVGEEERTIVAGIAKSYLAEEVIGRTVIIVSNLKPRKLMGVESNGMVLAVHDGETLRLIGPEGDMDSGLKVS